MSHASSRLWRYAALMLGIVILIIVVIAVAGQSPSSQTIVLPTEIQADDWKKGNPEGDVVLVEYADFQCPACAAMLPLVNRALEDYGDRMVLVYRHLPLITLHANALEAAWAAEAAGIQGKFFEMGNLLYANQSEWSALPDPLQTFQGYAESIGIDKAQFTADYSSDAVAQAVRADLQSATAAGLTSTPTFFLNGKQFQQNPTNYDIWKALIEDALATTNQSPE